MKKMLRQITGISFLVVGGLVARELRTPLPLYQGYSHFPFLQEKHEDGKDEWYVNIWGGAWFRTAGKAYASKGDCDNCSTSKSSSCGCQTSCSALTDFSSDGHCSRHTVPLSTLFFGKSDFRGEEAFCGSTIASPGNPWLNISTMKPRVRYTEEGVTFGINIDRSFREDTLNVGVRMQLPYRVIEVDRVTDCCNQFSSELGGERLEDVVDYKAEKFPDGGPPATQRGLVNYAYRLDFLSQLNYAVVGPAVNEPLVNYANTDFTNHITIANQDLSTGNVRTLKSSSGDKPKPLTVAYGSTDDPEVLPSTVGGISALTDNTRNKFNDSNYSALGNSREAQKTLWIVPKIEQADGSINQALEAKHINEAVNNLLTVLDDSAEDYFTRNNVCFQAQRNQGVGDFDTDFFVNYVVSDYWWVEGMLGFRWPSGGRIKDPNRTFLISRGNGGHVEAKFEILTGWNPERLDWFSLTADLEYAHVFRRTEKVAAPFKGATVKNIGPCIDADISWNYFIGNLDFTFVEPNKQHSGLNLGYQLYIKGKDSVCVDCKTATDFSGQECELDNCILETRTHVRSHKFKGEFFMLCNACHIFGGWTHVFAGKNAPRETDWYAGIQVNF